MGIFNYDKNDISTLTKGVTKDISDLKLSKPGLNLLLGQTNNKICDTLAFGLLSNYKFKDALKRIIVYVSFSDYPLTNCKRLISIITEYGIVYYDKINNVDDFYMDEYSLGNCMILTDNVFPDILYVNIDSNYLSTCNINDIIDRVLCKGYNIESIIVNDVTKLKTDTPSKFSNNASMLTLVSNHICMKSKQLDIPFIIYASNLNNTSDMSAFINYMLPVVEQSNLVIRVSDRMECGNDGTLVTRVIKNRS